MLDAGASGSAEQSLDLDSHNITQPPAPTPSATLQVDPFAETDFNDADSAIESSNHSTKSVSLASSILDYKYENGRRYHAYRAGAYLLPNDELEQDRLDLRHHIYRLILNGELFRAPISATPHRVLDVGTGTGIWAMDFADEFPSAVVIGTDLSPIQPQWVPPNCKFLVDDAESDWLYAPDEAFDFIHARALAGSIADWPRFYRQVYAHLKPGGWVEVQELETCTKSDDNTVERSGKGVTEWQKYVDEALDKFGKTLNIAEMHKQRIIDAGFVDVRDDTYKIPIGRWPKDPKLKEVGMYHLENLLTVVEAFSLAPLIRVLGLSNESVQVLMANARNDFRNRQNHFYNVQHFVYGRKPLTEI